MMAKNFSTLEKNVLVRMKQLGGSATIEQLSGAAPDLNKEMFIDFMVGMKKRLGGTKRDGPRMVFEGVQAGERPHLNTTVQLDVAVYASIKTF